MRLKVFLGLHDPTHAHTRAHTAKKDIFPPCGFGSSQPQEAPAVHQSVLLSWEFPNVSHGQHSHTAGQQHPGFTRIKHLIIAKQHKRVEAQWKHSCVTML